MAENLDAEIAEETKKSKEILIKELGVQIENKDLSLKQRRDASKQRQTLIKANHTLGGDLKKNYQDLKDGITTTVDGFINEAFGPLGGMVSSLTTGFFKRDKDNRGEAKNTELQVEAAQDLANSFKEKKEEDADVPKDIKAIATAMGSIDDKTLSLEDQRELARQKGKGGAVAGKDKMKVSDFDFPTAPFAALGIALGAAGGLAAPGLFQLAKFPPLVENFKTKFVPKINKIFGTDFPELHKGTIKYGDTVGDVTRNAKGQFAKVTKTSKGILSSIPKSFDDLATKMKGLKEGMKLTAGADEVAGIGSKFGGVAKFLVKGVVGRALSVAGNPVFSLIAQGKDIFDIANVVGDDDVKTAVKNEDIGAVIGGFLGGAIGVIGGPAGIALGIGLGNMAGEFIGGAMDDPEVLGAIQKVRDGLTNEKTELLNEIVAAEEKLKDKNISEPMRKMLQAQVDANSERVRSINAELKGMEDLKEKEEELKAIEKKANDAIAMKQNLEKQLELAEERGDTARIKMLEGMIDDADAEFDKQEKAYETTSEELRQQAAKTSEGLKDNVLSFFGKFTSLEDNPISNFFGSMFGGDEKTDPKAGSNAFRQARGVNTSARGGIIVNRPAYLPTSGTVIGEHGTFNGRGAARGMISDGGPEAVIPLSSGRAQGFITPIAASIAGQVMNNLAMDRVGMGGAGGMNSAPTVIDNSSQPIITNNTIINSPEPQGPMLPGAGRDHAVSHFRHAA